MILSTDLAVDYRDAGKGNEQWRRWLRTTLKVSFQFHHTQMDGAHAARFLDLLQQEIRSLGS